MHPERYELAIVGAGLSGTMVAAHWLRAPGANGAIALIDQTGAWGRGVAYNTSDAAHLLNVPAGKMSAYPDDSGHFVRWLGRRGLPDDPAGFAPRRVFGAYVSETLAEAEVASEAGLHRLALEAVGVHLEQDGVALALADGSTLRARRVVLAIGHFPPADPWVPDRSFYASPRYIGTPWRPDALAGLDAAAPVVLIGAGLTAVDLALSLVHEGHRGPIHMVARSGRMPQAHVLGPAASLVVPPEAEDRISALVAWVRFELAKAEREGRDWRSVIDGLRPHTQRLWQGLSLSERRRFLRHVRPFWEAYRHRMAPEVAAVIDRLRASGQLQVHAGRLLGFEETGGGVEVRLRRRGSDETISLAAARVINCTGPECDFRKLRHPLVVSLLEQGLVRPDPLGLGLVTAEDGAMLEAAGTPSRVLFTLGPPRKGMLWETTAVPELRGQAQMLASRLREA